PAPQGQGRQHRQVVLEDAVEDDAADAQVVFVAVGRFDGKPAVPEADAGEHFVGGNRWGDSGFQGGGFGVVVAGDQDAVHEWPPGSVIACMIATAERRGNRRIPSRSAYNAWVRPRTTELHPMKCEIISIGSELTSGQNLDTNSQWLSRRL